MSGGPNPFSVVPVPITADSYAADGLSARTGGAISAEDMLRRGVSADDLYRAYPDEGMRFYRGMRVERDADGRLQIFEQRPTEIGGERLQSGILNFSQDPRHAQDFAMRPGGNTFAGDTPILLETRPITRDEASRYFHSDNFNPRIFQDGLSTTDKWDMHADTRLPDVVQRVHVFEDGQWRPARPDEVAWRPRPGMQVDGVDGARPDAGADPRATNGNGTARTTAGDAGGARGAGDCATCSAGGGTRAGGAGTAGDAGVVLPPPEPPPGARSAPGAPPPPADGAEAFARAQRTGGSEHNGVVYAVGGTADDHQVYRYTPDGQYLGPADRVPRGATELGVSSQIQDLQNPGVPRQRFFAADDGRRFAIGADGLAEVRADGTLRTLPWEERAALPRAVQNQAMVRAAGPALAMPDGVNGGIRRRIVQEIHGNYMDAVGIHYDIDQAEERARREAPRR